MPESSCQQAVHPGGQPTRRMLIPPPEKEEMQFFSSNNWCREAEELILVQRQHYFYGPPGGTQALQQLPIHPLRSLDSSGPRAHIKHAEVTARRHQNTRSLPNLTDKIRHRWRD